MCLRWNVAFGFRPLVYAQPAMGDIPRPTSSSSPCRLRPRSRSVYLVLQCTVQADRPTKGGKALPGRRKRGSASCHFACHGTAAARLRQGTSNGVHRVGSSRLFASGLVTAPPLPISANQRAALQPCGGGDGSWGARFPTFGDGATTTGGSRGRADPF